MNVSKSLISSSLLITCLVWMTPNCVAQTEESQNSAALQPTLITATVSTAVPALVPYAAFAMDASGKPLNGAIAVHFQLYQDEEGGNPLWSETQTVSFDPTGHYNVQLGATSTSGLPVAIFSSGKARWLDVRIAGQTQQPRVLMTSVPYAFKTADTATLGGLPSSAFVHADPAATTVSHVESTATATGKVTSVGLTAPSSDFTVTGSPVTTSGTLGLHWVTPPSSSSTPNSIVKRDATGSFAAGAVTAIQAQGTGLNNYGVGGASQGNAVAGYAMSDTAQTGVYGVSLGSGPVSDGVHGVSSNALTFGVSGTSNVTGVSRNGGIAGVSGNGGIGVFGTGSNYGFVAQNNVAQDLNSGGWIKAIAYINAKTTPYSITGCFNSTLPGSQATTPPCGLVLNEVGEEVFNLSFNFDISKRFYATTLANARQDVDLYFEPVGANVLQFSTFSGLFMEPAGAEYTVVVF